MNPTMTIPQQVTVGSLNPVKLEATERALDAVFDVPIKVIGQPTASGVSTTPWTTEETLLGAVTRALATTFDDPHQLGVGLEGGLTTVLGRTYCIGWAVVADASGRYCAAPTVGVEIPPPLMDLVKSGLELGDAEDIYFHRSNSKQNGGLIGIITEDKLERVDTFYPALVSALSSLALQKD